MKDPETVRRIEALARAESLLAVVRVALTHTTEATGYVVPSDHPIAVALQEARLAVSKADVLTTQLLKRFQR